MRRAFSLHIPPSLRIHRWEGGMQCERLSVCGGHPAAAGALYGAGGGGGLSGASGRRAPHPADALRHGGGHHAGRQRVEPAAACHREGGGRDAAGLAGPGGGVGAGGCGSAAAGRGCWPADAHRVLRRRWRCGASRRPSAGRWPLRWASACRISRKARR